MQKHLVNLRRFHDMVRDLAKLAGSDYSLAQVEIRDMEGYPELREEYHWMCHIKDVGLYDGKSMDDCLAGMKKMVEAKLAEQKSEPAAMPVESNDDDIF